MPELPEVETIRRDIEPFVKKKAIRAVKIIRAHNVLKGINERGIKRALEGQRIEKVERRGKYLIFKLVSGGCLIIHLGMTGKILKKPDRFVKVEFKLSNGKSFYFSDIRMFGRISYSKTYPVWQLGPEPLTDDFTADRLGEIFKGRKTNIKSLLLDQKAIAGVGNIYASEALFLAGIDPKRKAGSLKQKEIQKLHKAIRQVLSEGIKHRGTSVSDYRDASGRRGGYQHRLRVYDREGQPCFKCKSPIKRIVVGQRGTYYCPKCQK
jgi:formamidopyrimidine-DNA glycosylase